MTNPAAIAPDRLRDFVAESNRIEGIRRPVTDAELAATRSFIGLDEITVHDLVTLVKIYQPNARLRDKPGLNVRVGSHVPPRGGPHVLAEFVQLMDDITQDKLRPFEAHQCYESLHPFTDGNGRSGRAIWLWQMVRKRGVQLSFLHHWYYQSLSEGR